jgi:hypothetical protein
VALLLVLGGLAIGVWPGALGLMAAALAHGAAWSLAWAGSLAQPARQRAEALAPRGLGRLAAAFGMGTATALLGLAVDAHGPAALVAVHAGIALLGVAGVVAQAVRGAVRVPAA